MINKLNKKIVRLIFLLFTVILIGLSFFSTRQDSLFLMSFFVVFTSINLFGFEHYFQKSQSLSEFNISLSIFVLAMIKFVLSISIAIMFIFFPSFPLFSYIFIEFILFTLAYIILSMMSISQEVIKSISGNSSNTFYLSLQEKIPRLHYDSSIMITFNKLKKMINLVSKISTDETLAIEQEILLKIEEISDNKLSNKTFYILKDLLLKREKLIEKKRD
jgi:hypothetical protein